MNILQKAQSIVGNEQQTKRFINNLFSQNRGPFQIEEVLVAAGHSRATAMQLIEECQTEDL